MIDLKKYLRSFKQFDTEKENPKYIISYPTLSIVLKKDIDGLSKLNVGDKKKIIMEVVLKRKTINSSEKGGNRFDYGFDVVDAEFPKDK